MAASTLPMSTIQCSRCPAEVPGREIRARFEGERLLYLCGPCEAKWAEAAEQARRARMRGPFAGLIGLLLACIGAAGIALLWG